MMPNVVMPNAMIEKHRSSDLKRALATVMDVVTIIVIAGAPIVWFAGEVTENSIRLHGWPAVLLLAIGFGYFHVGRRMAGGTLWDRILGIGRPQLD